MWRHCGCGYDFGETKFTRTADDVARPSGELELQEQQDAERSRRFRPIGRFLWWLDMAAWVVLLINSWWRLPGWSTIAATGIALALFWVPFKVGPSGNPARKESRRAEFEGSVDLTK
jgi:hypothetical protein